MKVSPKIGVLTSASYFGASKKSEGSYMGKRKLNQKIKGSLNRLSMARQGKAGFVNLEIKSEEKIGKTNLVNS